MGLEDQHALAGAPMFVPDVSATVTSKWAKGSGGPAGAETLNLVTFEAPRTGEFIRSNIAGTITKESGGTGETRNPAFVMHDAPPKAACLETTNHDYSRADGFTAVAFNWQEGPGGSLGMSDADTGGSPPVRVHQTLAVAEQSVVRRLTPVECCRLQGFPDDWNSEGIDKTGKRIQMADAPRYRQLGNAVTVNVANWIANNLAAVYAAPKEPANGEP